MGNEFLEPGIAYARVVQFCVRYIFRKIFILEAKNKAKSRYGSQTTKQGHLIIKRQNVKNLERTELYCLGLTTAMALQLDSKMITTK